MRRDLLLLVLICNRGEQELGNAQASQLKAVSQPSQFRLRPYGPRFE